MTARAAETGGSEIEFAFASKMKSPRLRDELIERPRLTDPLVGDLGRLVLVSAPPGFGKSTLLAQWDRLDPRNFAFVSVEPADNDPAELWSAIVFSIRQAYPSMGESVEASLGSLGALALESIVRRVVAELERLEEPIVLALEDVHVIKNHDCLASIESLVAHPAGPVTVVLTTRADPPIPLGRLRASGELIEIRAADLAFTADETEEILNGVIGLDLTTQDVAILHEHTEGWPVGIHLASLGLRTTDDPAAFLRSFGGSNRHVVDYLAEVVIDAVDESVRRFMLETSMLSRLSGPLCDAVTGGDDSASMLDLLDRSNLFMIPLDDHRQWFRYHHLFGELLAERLHSRFPSRVQELHKQAARWWDAAGEPVEAIRHSIAAGELETATELVAQNWTGLAARGRLVTLLEWFDAFPRGYVEGQARLSMPRAWMLGMLGRVSEARRSMDDALRAGYDQPLPDGSGTLEQSAAMLRSSFPWSHVGELRAAAHAVERFRDSLAPPFQAQAAFGIGMANVLSGELGERTRRELDRSMELATEYELWVIAANSLGFRAHLALAESLWEEAQRFGRRAIELATEQGFLDLPPMAYYEAAWGAAIARSGRLAEGDALIARRLDQLDGWDPLLGAHARLLGAPVRRQMGDTDGSRRLLQEAREVLKRCGDPGVIGDLAIQVARAISTSHRRGTERTDPTDREMDVLRLLEKGLSKRDIATELFLSFNTIHTHTKSLYAKLDASDRDEVIARARERGLL